MEEGSSGNPDAKRLYDDLLSNYNKLVRPVVNVTDALTVKIKLKLSQLIDVTYSSKFHNPISQRGRIRHSLLPVIIELASGDLRRCPT
ncbi:hypothetical protein J437_LFUL009693 [Ladona fulva]|uniref:Neurotransmitter-gated ion-channel ligand-binding domain-containing protein n=1 Tax=Ladona fulva TaxID=123851 RepID=A0A8K0K7N8_LADFU|nr:hypothetical protein J437_LFUL009693 [Ladona fulva]